MKYRLARTRARSEARPLDVGHSLHRVSHLAVEQATLRVADKAVVSAFLLGDVATTAQINLAASDVQAADYDEPTSRARRCGGSFA